MNKINRNLLKVKRTDSMDQTIDRLNQATDHSINNSGYINLFTLKLNDINKELEYNQSINPIKEVQNCVLPLWVSVLLLTACVTFKIIPFFNSQKDLLTDKVDDAIQDDLEKEPKS
jgi:hypothetical protein